MRDHINTVTIPSNTGEDVTITLDRTADYSLDNYFADTITYDVANDTMDFNVISPDYVITDGVTTKGSTLRVTGDVEVDGVSLKGFMDTVNDRLAILQPKPEMLEKYEALRNAYNEYKMLEKLCSGADTDAD